MTDAATKILVPAVLYEDEVLLALDKPAGITVNRSETTQHEYTIQDWLSERLHKELQIADPESDFFKRSGFVHRIDKETSGILLVAKTEAAFLELQRQFKERLTHKQYLALVHGHMTPRTGEIRIPVGRLPWNRARFGVVPGGKESVTVYEVEAGYRLVGEPLSLVRLFPETGRTHQIRVHLKYAGFPIFADFLYAGRKTSAKDRRTLERVFLHAAYLSFIHPVHGTRLEIRSQLPIELTNVLATLAPEPGSLYD